jgi:membrane protein YqaA with SNARE-associated domain
MLKRSHSPALSKFIQTKPILWLLGLFKSTRGFIRKMYKWVIGWAEKPQAEKALGAIAVAESSFFPIPPDPLLITMTLAKPKRYLRFAAICTVGSVVGGVLGYLIGVGLFETVGQWIIDTYSLQEDFIKVGELYAANAALALFTAAFTPIPYKLFTIAAGVFAINFPQFVLASLVGRGARFFLVATLMYHFGKRYKDKIEKYVDILSLIFVALIILGVLALRFIF